MSLTILHLKHHTSHNSYHLFIAIPSVCFPLLSTNQMNIILWKHLIGALWVFNLIFAKDLKYFSNFKPSAAIIVGRESAVTDFVTMTNSPESDLPNEFTICNSLFIEVMTSMQNIVTVMKKDGTHWFSISYEVARLSTREQLYYCVQTGKYLFKNYNFFILFIDFLFLICIFL